MIRFGIMAILAVTAHGFLSPRKLDGKREMVKVNFMNDYRQGNRFARSTGEGETFRFPEVLIFNVTVEGDVVTLTLHLSNVNHAYPPVFVYEDGELVQREQQDSRRRALYQDVNSRASYLVTCNGPEPEQCSLHGSFYRGAKRYHMSPRNNVDTTGMHDLIHVEEVIKDFTGDYLVPPGNFTNGTRNDDSTGPTRRSKRALPDANIVELLALPDESVYQAYLAMEGTEEDAEDAMGLYYALLTNEIDLNYLGIPMVNASLNLNIRVSLAGLVIAKNGSEAEWSRDNTVVRNRTTYLNEGGPNGALKKFTGWRFTRRKTYIEHDHAMGFTMKNLAYVYGEYISSSLVGKAWRGTVCHPYYGTSITEDGGIRVASIAAHELGHGLGAGHDGDWNTCNSENYNVMTTLLYTAIGAEHARAQWTFSSCSVDQFNRYINSIGSDHCMTKHKSIAADTLDDPLPLPGQYYSLDQQCQFRISLSSSACSSLPVPESSCHSGLRCHPNCNSTVNLLYALAGTPCGAADENKWCYKGICTRKPTNPTTTTTTEEPTTTTTTEEPTTTTTTEEPTTTTTEEPTTTTTTEEPTTTTTTEEPTTTTTTTTTTTEEPTTTTTTEEPTTTTTTEEPTTTTTTEEPTTTTTTEEPTTTTTTEEPTTTTTTEEPSTTTTTEEPTTTTTTEEPTTTTTTEEPPVNFCKERCYKVKKNKKTKKWCKGKKCCKKSWGKQLPCCTKCKN